MLGTEKKKLSCSNCRKIKRKCDGGHPCASCAKKNVSCDYNTTDRRSQRYSIGYIKSLETNNDVLEGILAELVAIRDDPGELAAKLESLSVSFPKKVEKPESLPEDLEESIEPADSDDSEKPFTEKDQYFGAGSVFHGRGAPPQGHEPLLASDQLAPTGNVITIEQDFDYVAGLVRGFFNEQYFGTPHTLFDKQRILHELENRNFSGPFLSVELVYAICAVSQSLTYEEADGYCRLVLKNLFQKTLASSIAVSQCYTLLAFHCASKGQISKAWLFSGIGIRIGLDIGFDMPNGENPCAIANRCFMGTIIVDHYLAMSLGRRSSLQQNSVPVLQLKGESRTDYLNIKYSVELIEMTRHMIRSTYQPVTFDKDPKINYLLKFNRSKVFNMKLLKWRQSLDPSISWSYTSLKSSKDLAHENHTVKFLYFYILLFLNKPFLHVPKQHSTVFLIEDMAKEVYLIVYSKLSKLEEQTGKKIYGHSSSDGLQPSNNKFCSSSMDICVEILLANVLVALIMSQPEHYIHLEKRFKTFAYHINYLNLRKYDPVGRPMSTLLEKFETFKVKMRKEALLSDDKLSDTEQYSIKEEQNSDMSSKSSPPTSESSNCEQGYPDSEFVRKSYNDVHPNQPWVPPQGVMPLPLPSATPVGNMQQGQESFTFDPWWQQLNYQNSRTQDDLMARGQNLSNPVMVQQSMPVPTPAAVPSVHQEAMHTNQQPFMNQAPVGFASFPHVKQEHDQFAQPMPGFDPQGIYSYDHLPRSKDPVDQMFNQLFSNSGEFLMDKGPVDWQTLFREQYPSVPR